MAVIGPWPWSRRSAEEAQHFPVTASSASGLCWSRFPALLRELDSEKGALGVRSYGLSVTTMEEVFLNVSRAATTAAALPHQANGLQVANSAQVCVTSCCDSHLTAVVGDICRRVLLLDVRDCAVMRSAGDD